MTRTSTCIWFLLLFVVSCRQSSEVFLLQPGLGSVYHFTVETEETRGDDTGSLFATTRHFEFALQLQKRVDSLQTFNLVVQRISLTRPETVMIDSPNSGHTIRTTGRLVTFATDSAQNSSTAEPFKQNWYNVIPRLVGDSVKIAVSKSNDVYNTWGYETIKKKIVPDTGDDWRTMIPAIREYLGPDAIRDLVQGLFFYLPERKIQKGDQWVRNVVLILYAPVKYSHNITVDAIKDDSVYLSVQTIVSSRQRGGRVITEGELTGKITASLSTGMPGIIKLTENSVIHTDNNDVKKKRIFRASAHQSPAR